MHQLNHFMYSSKENGKQAYNQASKHAHDLIFQYIEIFYNTTRIHGFCDMQSPYDFENQVAN